MLFGKERRRVARVIRDLVVRPRSNDQMADRDLGSGLQVLVKLASAPLRSLPETAARLPAVLRELGERRRGIPPARRTIPNPALALGALTGGLTNDEVLRTRYLNLLAASMDRATSGQVHPGFLSVLRQMTPDETRIFSRFESDGRAASTRSARRCTWTTSAVSGSPSCGRRGCPRTRACSSPSRATPRSRA
jgi:hypothetical protein